jgi:ADP-ribose pyrophosphatase
MSGKWHALKSEVCVDSPYLRVLREHVATPTRPDGVEWMVVRRKQAIVIAPQTASGGFLLVRQERVPIQTELWEFPAGQIDGDGSEADTLATVHRELAEETGCRTLAPLISLGNYWPSAGFTDEYCHLFLATGVHAYASSHQSDHNEMILECREFSPSALWAMITDGTICDANTLATVARLVALRHLSP